MGRKVTSQNRSSRASRNRPIFSATNIEESVYAVVEDILGVRPSRNTRLADAGLDSLGASELLSKLNSQLSTDLPPALLFEYETMGDICDFVSLQDTKVDDG